MFGFWSCHKETFNKYQTITHSNSFVHWRPRLFLHKSKTKRCRNQEAWCVCGIRGVWRLSEQRACCRGCADGCGERTLAWGSSAWPSSAQSRRLKDGSTAIYRVHSSVVIALTLRNWSKQSLGASRSRHVIRLHIMNSQCFPTEQPTSRNRRTIINLFNEGCSTFNRHTWCWEIRSKSYTCAILITTGNYQLRNYCD